MQHIAACLFLLVTGVAMAQELPATTASATTSCDQLLKEKLRFMSDGSLSSEKALVPHIQKLAACGLDEFDLGFFANMDVFSAMMTRISKNKKVDQMTFDDLYKEILKFKESSFYAEMREVSIASEQLGKKIGNIQQWQQDRLLFEQLGASRNIIEKVVAYLHNNPNNTLTYRQILEKITQK